MKITGRFKGGKARKKSKALPVFLTIFGILILLGGIGFVLSQVEKDTYVVQSRLEGTSGYPPQLTVIRSEGITPETALLSIIPTLNFRGLSITEQHTTLKGLFKIDCGGDFQETKNFNLFTDIPGDKMVQSFTFKGVPADSVCFITAQALECETHHITCVKNKISLMVRTP